MNSDLQISFLQTFDKLIIVPQQLCLKVILGQENEGYQKVLKLLGLKSLLECREKFLQVGLKSPLHPVHCKMFHSKSDIS